MSVESSATVASDSYRRFFELPLDQWDLFDSVNLRRSKIVLASDLNPVIDFFNSPEVGIGARNASEAAAELNLDRADQSRLAALLRLRSYDIYTLRAALGNHLSPQSFERLSLPESERRVLEDYTRDYTRALFALIFEDSGVEASDRQGMRDLLEGTSREIVQRNVLTIAKKFDVQPADLVNYIGGVGDMLLAIAFYRRAFEAHRPTMQRFLTDMKTLHDNDFLCSRHMDLRQNAGKMLHLGARTVKVLDAYFRSFNQIGRIWQNITPERFRKIRDSVEQQYPVIGAALCIWQVKMNAWTQRFYRPDRKSSDNSLVQFAVFFEERIFPDFDKIAGYLDRIQSFDQAAAA